MSGGSFDYLYSKEASELCESRYELHNMADFMATEFPGTSAQIDTEQLVTDIETFIADVNKRIDALQKVWQAIEWWQSYDSVREDAQKAVDRYKMEKVTPHMTWVPNG